MKRNLDHLPKASTKEKTQDVITDERDPLIWDLVNRAVDERVTTDLAMADPSARVRHSHAGQCSRRIAFEMHPDFEATDPPNLAARINFLHGHLVHDQLQRHVDGATEVQVVTHRADGTTRSAGHVDAVTTDRVLEFKTKNGRKFRESLTKGPDANELLQLAVNAYGVWQSDDESTQLPATLVYFSKERVVASTADRNGIVRGDPELNEMVAAWTMTPDEWKPMAEAELDRWDLIIDIVDAGGMPPGMIPSAMPQGATIKDPQRGYWQVEIDGQVKDSGTTWQCGYCPFQSICGTVQ